MCALPLYLNCSVSDSFYSISEAHNLIGSKLVILVIIFTNLGNLLTAAGNDVISPLHYTEFGVLPLGDYTLKLLPHACLSLILAALVVWILEIRGDNIIQPRTHVYIRDVVSR